MVETSGEEISEIEIENALGLLLRYFPPGFLEVRSYCGDVVMWGLFKHYAGQRLVVPRNMPDPHHQLIVCLGLEAVMKLVECFGGEVINVPVCDAAKRWLRDESVRKMVKAGLSINQVVAKVGLTYRQVQRIAQGVLPDEEPLTGSFDLFDLD